MPDQALRRGRTRWSAYQPVWVCFVPREIGEPECSHADHRAGTLQQFAALRLRGLQGLRGIGFLVTFDAHGLVSLVISGRLVVCRERCLFNLKRHAISMLCGVSTCRFIFTEAAFYAVPQHRSSPSDSPKT